MNIAVILAGGVGKRYGDDMPKQYLKMAGREVISFAIEEAKKCCYVDKVIVVCDKIYQQRISSNYSVEVCDGGETRNISVFNALEYIKANYKCNKIIFLDSARPLIKADYITDCLQKLDNYDCIITAQHIVDSLGNYCDVNVNRDNYYLIQTPEAFKYDVLYKNFDKESSNTALCQFMPDINQVYQNFALKHNYKITYKGDIEYIMQFVNNEVI